MEAYGSRAEPSSSHAATALRSLESHHPSPPHHRPHAHAHAPVCCTGGSSCTLLAADTAAPAAAQQQQDLCAGCLVVVVVAAAAMMMTASVTMPPLGRHLLLLALHQVAPAGSAAASCGARCCSHSICQTARCSTALITAPAPLTALLCVHAAACHTAACVLHSLTTRWRVSCPVPTRWPSARRRCCSWCVYHSDEAIRRRR